MPAKTAGAFFRLRGGGTLFRLALQLSAQQQFDGGDQPGLRRIAPRRQSVQPEEMRQQIVAHTHETCANMVKARARLLGPAGTSVR